MKIEYEPGNTLETEKLDSQLVLDNPLRNCTGKLS
jgi:hypothetical protein